MRAPALSSDPSRAQPRALQGRRVLGWTRSGASPCDAARSCVSPRDAPSLPCTLHTSENTPSLNPPHRPSVYDGLLKIQDRHRLKATHLCACFHPVSKHPAGEGAPGLRCLVCAHSTWIDQGQEHSGATGSRSKPQLCLLYWTPALTQVLPPVSPSRMWTAQSPGGNAHVLQWLCEHGVCTSPACCLPSPRSSGPGRNVTQSPRQIKERTGLKTWGAPHFQFCFLTKLAYIPIPFPKPMLEKLKNMGGALNTRASWLNSSVPPAERHGHKQIFLTGHAAAEATRPFSPLFSKTAPQYAR